MKKLLITLVVLGGVFGGWWYGYEILNNADVSVDQAWGQVESVLQRRYDLIPNLVETVKGYAKHESGVFSEVAKARAEIGKVNFGSLAGDQAQMAEFAKLNSEMSSALSRLLAVVENYPQLKADQNFLTLQSQLEGTENRINVERQRYNQAVGSLNYYVRNLVIGVLAKIHGFEKRAYFKADEAAQKAPAVKFG